MRIIAGKWGGRRLASPPGAGTTRPTADRVREGVASALDARGAFDGARTLDLFAGTGAWGLEALSRGASAAVLLDHDRAALRSLRANIAALTAENVATARAVDLARAPERVARDIADAAHDVGLAAFDLVFADPPYAAVGAVAPLCAALLDAGLLERGAWVVVEHAETRPPSDASGLAEVARYRYGRTQVVVLRADSPSPPGNLTLELPERP